MSVTNQRGNIFTVLFGAVAVVGIITAATMQIISGPIRTATRVNAANMTEANMMGAIKILVVDAASQANSGDGDSDGYIEPREYTTQSGGITGGGSIPIAVGAARTDPWGTLYGYCVWDAGPIDNGKNDAGTGSTNRLNGANNETDTVIAIVSAGPNKMFETSCAAFDGAGTDGVVRVAGSDDRVLKWSYAEARSQSSGLWAIKSGTPATATINKSLEVTDPDNSNAITASIDRTTGIGDFLGLTTDLITAKTAGGIQFNTSTNTNVMRVHNNGNVGIGTTVPTNKLTVNGGSVMITRADGTYANLTLQSNAEADAWGGPRMAFYRARGTTASTAITSGDYTGWLDFWGYDGAAMHRSAQIIAMAGGTVSSGIVPGAVSIRTADAAGNINERMLIGATGNVTINTGALGVGAFPSSGKLHIKQSSNAAGGGIYLERSDNTSSGRIWMDASDNFNISRGTASSTLVLNTAGQVGVGKTPSYSLDTNGDIRANSTVYTSDARLKKDVSTLDNALELVTKLRGVHFEWIKPADDGQKGVQTGLIAQEVEKVYPELVRTDKEGWKSVNYASLVAPLIEAVKELKAMLDNIVAKLNPLADKVLKLEKENEALYRHIDVLEKRVDALEGAGKAAR